MRVHAKRAGEGGFNTPKEGVYFRGSRGVQEESELLITRAEADVAEWCPHLFNANTAAAAGSHQLWLWVHICKDRSPEAQCLNLKMLSFYWHFGCSMIIYFSPPTPPHLPSCYRIIHIPLSASSSTIYSVINGTEYKSGKV